MIEYIVFFGMFIFAIILYWQYEKKPKEAPTLLDPEKHKCDLAIEMRLYDALKASGEYIRTQPSLLTV